MRSLRRHGGAKSGNVASSLALDVFIQEVKRLRKPSMTAEQVGRMFQEAAGLANFTVYDQSRQFEDFAGMAPRWWRPMWTGRRL